MEKIYSNSEEKYLKAVLLYAVRAVGGDTFGLFYDAEGAQPAHNSDYDWKDLFIKGLIKVAALLHGEYITYNPMCIIMPGGPLAATISLGFGGDYVAEFFADEVDQNTPDPGDGGEL